MNRRAVVDFLLARVDEEQGKETSLHYPRRNRLADLAAKRRLIELCDVPDDHPAAQLADAVLDALFTSYAGR